MTTREINQKFEELTKEINKVKSFSTKLVKKLQEKGIEVPNTNWSEEPTKQDENSK